MSSGEESPDGAHTSGILPQKVYGSEMRLPGGFPSKARSGSAPTEASMASGQNREGEGNLRRSAAAPSPPMRLCGSAAVRSQFSSSSASSTVRDTKLTSTGRLGGRVEGFEPPEHGQADFGHVVEVQGLTGLGRLDVEGGGKARAKLTIGVPSPKHEDSDQLFLPPITHIAIIAC